MRHLASVLFFGNIVMKLIVAVFALLAVSAFAEDNYDNIDWSKVVPVTQLPGFWDGRDFGPAYYPGATRGSRIVGGNIVTPHSHPYQAGLLINFGGGTGLCGGSLVSQRAVLTAAHCSVGSSSTLVILGAHVLSANEGTQHRQTVNSWDYRIHHSYNDQNLQNDVSILLLPGNAPLNNAIRVIELAGGNSWDFAGEWATMTGWGGIDGGGTSTHLRWTNNNIISNAQCSSTLANIIHSTICTSTAGGRGTCGGDSGGPLTVQFQGQSLLVGVTSFVVGGCGVSKEVMNSCFV